MKTICADLTKDGELPHAELLIANLFIEYVGYECFQRAVKKVSPQYVSCLIQINQDNSFVSDSPYLHALETLEQVHHTVEEERLLWTMEEIGYKQKMRCERELPNGKKLLRMDFLHRRQKAFTA